MHYIIDAYNYIHQIPSMRRYQARARSVLVRRLSSFCDYCQVAVTLVFDGTSVENSYHDSYHGVDVKYSGACFSADALIERFVMKDSLPGQICVVTADRKIRQMIATQGAFSMTPKSFESEMQFRIKMSKRELANRLRKR